MDGRQTKFVLIGAGMLISMTVLIVAGMGRSGGFSYYLTVSEFLVDPRPADDRYRVNGKVVQGSIDRLPSGHDVRFAMSDGTRSLGVHYNGIIPDTFVDGADVVVQGHLGADGTFQAHTLLAKCPSKYESADGAEGAAAPY